MDNLKLPSRMDKLLGKTKLPVGDVECLGNFGLFRYGIKRGRKDTSRVLIVEKIDKKT